MLIHNFRPGVPERLGIGYEDIAVLNPGIIYLQCNGYGPDGPGAQRPSTHPIPGAAMGGVLFQLAERVPEELQNIENLTLWTRRLMHSNEVNPDPNTAVVVATSVMLGLVARQRTGQGQQILIYMFGANAYANHDDLYAFELPGFFLAKAIFPKDFIIHPLFLILLILLVILHIPLGLPPSLMCLLNFLPFQYKLIR